MITWLYRLFWNYWLLNGNTEEGLADARFITDLFPVQVHHGRGKKEKCIRGDSGSG
jgi:hypothetical protein